MKNVLKTFNKPDTTVVITSFPNPKDNTSGNKGFNAVAWHSQKTLVELSKHAPVLVLAEKRPDGSRLTVNEHLHVERTWTKGNIFSLLALFQLISKLTKVQSVFIQFEFNVFGGILPNLMLLLLIAILRLTGKRVTFELHQVITDVGLLKKHVPIKNKLIQKCYNAGLVVFYRVLGLVANTIVVFEETLKSRLSQFVQKDKIEVLCLSVEKKQTIDKAMARKKINKMIATMPVISSNNERSQKISHSVRNDDSEAMKQLNNDEFVVMVFGFINGYKGIDWITKALGNTNLPIRLLVAGGQNPYLKDQPHYQKLYNSIVGEIKKHKHMTYRDFVPDELVTTYFSAADVIVLPYEVFMSASGPFSLALSYGKPVLLSEKLLPYAQSRDVQEALEKANLSEKDIFFKLTKIDLEKKLSSIQAKSHIEKLTNFSNTLADSRESEKIVLRLHNILHVPSQISVPVARLSSPKTTH